MLTGEVMRRSCKGARIIWSKRQ